MREPGACIGRDSVSGRAAQAARAKKLFRATLSYDKYYDNFTKNIFPCSLASESCYSKSGYSFPDWSWVGIRDSQAKSRQSRLIRDTWTLCKGFWGSRGMLPRKKLEIRGLQSAGNALKLSILPSPCYFCIILNILRSHKADLFGSWRGGAPSCLQACIMVVTGRAHCSNLLYISLKLF